MNTSGLLEIGVEVSLAEKMYSDYYFELGQFNMVKLPCPHHRRPVRWHLSFEINVRTVTALQQPRSFNNIMQLFAPPFLDRCPTKTQWHLRSTLVSSTAGFATV